MRIKYLAQRNHGDLEGIQAGQTISTDFISGTLNLSAMQRHPLRFIHIALKKYPHISGN